MNGSNGTLLEVRDAPPRTVEVDEEQRKVAGVRKALRDTGVVRVKNKWGRTLFYCLEPAEYRRLKDIEEAEEG